MKYIIKKSDESLVQKLYIYVILAKGTQIIS